MEWFWITVGAAILISFGACFYLDYRDKRSNRVVTEDWIRDLEQLANGGKR